MLSKFMKSAKKWRKSKTYVVNSGLFVICFQGFSSFYGFYVNWKIINGSYDVQKTAIHSTFQAVKSFEIQFSVFLANFPGFRQVSSCLFTF